MSHKFSEDEILAELNGEQSEHVDMICDELKAMSDEIDRLQHKAKTKAALMFEYLDAQFPQLGVLQEPVCPMHTKDDGTHILVRHKQKGFLQSLMDSIGEFP